MFWQVLTPQIILYDSVKTKDCSKKETEVTNLAGEHLFSSTHFLDLEIFMNVGDSSFMFLAKEFNI